MSIENTSQRDPIAHLAGALGGTDEYITGMEAAGQRQLVASTKLPAKASGFNTAYGEDGWAEFEALGFVKGDPVPGDPLFVEATLPEGWSKQAGHGSMGSYVVDDRGVRRVSVFYKAAFYDRRADMHLINVGWNLATEVLYGDGTAALPEQWDVLDAVERAEFERALEYAIQESKEHPDHLPRTGDSREDGHGPHRQGGQAMTIGLGNCVDLEWFETRPPMVEAARLTLSTFTGVATVLDGQGYTNIRTEHLDGHQLRLCADSPGSPGPGLLPPLPWHLPFGKLAGVPGCAESLDAAHRALAYPFGAWLFQNADGRLCALPESMFFELYRKRAQ